MTLTPDERNNIVLKVRSDNPEGVSPEMYMVATEQALLSKLKGVTDEEAVEEVAKSLYKEYDIADLDYWLKRVRQVADKLSAVHNAQMQKAVEEALSKHCRNCNLFLKNTKVFKGG